MFGGTGGFNWVDDIQFVQFDKAVKYIHMGNLEVDA